MPHFRRRHALALFENYLKHSPLVGVFGHRQVGKTSFVSHEISSYITFDEFDKLREAEQSPKSFISSFSHSRTVIDECQLCPPLFPALKEWVRTHKKPGQFVLTGSVRFSSRKAIRESLTGRLLGFELFPLVLSELLDQPLPDTILRLIKCRLFDESIRHSLLKPTRAQQNAWTQFLEQGGLPKIAFTRNPRTRLDLIDSILRLILDRDLRMVIDTQLSLETLLRFLGFIAEKAWDPFNFSEARRRLGLSEVTQKRLLYGLESIFLIRRIPIYGRKGAAFILEDQLEEWVLSKKNISMERRLYGALYRNLRAQFAYRSGIPFEAFSFQLRSGAWIPLVFKNEDGELGFLFQEESSPSLGQIRSANRFLRDFPQGKIIYVVSHSMEPEVLDQRVLRCSASSLLL